MTKKERLQFFLTWVAIGIAPLFLRSLWEPDEARYMEIPREMLASGDWLTPTLNYVHYFEKPPLQYWLSAIGMKLFGLHGFAARLPLALATFLVMISAWRLAKRLGAKRPLWASFMAVTCLLGFTAGSLLTLDGLFSALLVTAFVLTLEAINARYEEKPSLLLTSGAFASIALALLTKGLAAPVILGGIFLASLIFAWEDTKLRRAVLAVMFHPLGILVFFAIAFPWFYFVEKANPGHADFFFIHEHFRRYTSTIHERQGSDNAILDKLYFLPFILVGLLPWLSTALRGFQRGTAFIFRRKAPAGDHYLLHRYLVAATILAIAVPFGFFSLSHSKLIPYIYPVIVPFAALSCAMERESEEPQTLKAHGWELLFIGAVLTFGAPFFFKESLAPGWVLVLGMAFLLLGAWTFRPALLTANRWIASLCAITILLNFTAEKAFGSNKCNLPLIRKAPANAQWISVGYFFHSIPLATGMPTVVVGGTGELAFGKNKLPEPTRSRQFIEDIKELNAVADRLKYENPSRPVWALVERKAWKRMDLALKNQWELKDANRRVVLVRYL